MAFPGDIPETNTFKDNLVCGLQEDMDICLIYLSSKVTPVTYIRQPAGDQGCIKQDLFLGEFKING